VDCEVREGSKEDAQRHAVGANADHGARRTNEDKRRAVLLAFDLWPDASDRQIAEYARVSAPTVGAVRKGTVKVLQSGQPEEDQPAARPRKGKDGRTINTGNIGRKKAPPADRGNHPAEPHPTASEDTPEEAKPAPAHAGR
jgi:hypothetical protein